MSQNGGILFIIEGAPCFGNILTDSYFSNTKVCKKLFSSIFIKSKNVSAQGNSFLWKIVLKISSDNKHISILSHSIYLSRVLYDNILNKLHLKLLFSVFSYVLFVKLYPSSFLIFRSIPNFFWLPICKGCCGCKIKIGYGKRKYFYEKSIKEHESRKIFWSIYIF